MPGMCFSVAIRFALFPFFLAHRQLLQIVRNNSARTMRIAILNSCELNNFDRIAILFVGLEYYSHMSMNRTLLPDISCALRNSINNCIINIEHNNRKVISANNILVGVKPVQNITNKTILGNVNRTTTTTMISM